AGLAVDHGGELDRLVAGGDERVVRVPEDDGVVAAASRHLDGGELVVEEVEGGPPIESDLDHVVVLAVLLVDLDGLACAGSRDRQHSTDDLRGPGKHDSA